MEQFGHKVNSRRTREDWQQLVEQLTHSLKNHILPGTKRAPLTVTGRYVCSGVTKWQSGPLVRLSFLSNVASGQSSPSASATYQAS